MDSQAKSQPPPLAKRVVDDEVDLLDYLRVTWRCRWMIVGLCVVAMTLTVVTSLRKPRQYQSSVMIVPPLDILQKESGGGLGSLNSPLLRQVMDTAAGGIAKMYVEILESREVADAIIDRFRLMEVYENIQYRSMAQGEHDGQDDHWRGGEDHGDGSRPESLDRDRQRLRRGA